MHWLTVTRILLVCLLASVVATSAAADEYADMAALLAAPIYSTSEQARAGYADESTLRRMEFVRRGMKDLDAVSLAKMRASGIHSRTFTKLDACRETLNRIRVLDGRTPDFAGIVDDAFKASPALVRNYQEQRSLPGDQEAVDRLIAKGVIEAINAGVTQLQLNEEWKTYRGLYAEFRDIALELGPLAKQRPCLFGLGVSYIVPVDGAHIGLAISRVAPDGPSELAGLRVGDVLVAVDDTPFVTQTGVNPRAIACMEPAAKGTTVKLRSLRGTKSIEFTVERTMPLNNVPNLFALKFSGSCDEALDSDELSMTNVSGVDLTNCTLLVTLATDNGDITSEQVRQHVHFIRHWPKDRKLIAIYHNAGSMRIARNESFQFVKRVTVDVFSDQFQGTNRYSYWNSGDRKADLKRYCESQLEFRGKYLPETDGLIGKGDGLYQSDAGIRVWLHPAKENAVPRLTPSEIVVSLYKGDASASETWAGLEWQGGGVVPFKTLCSPRFNALERPDIYEMRLRFHGTDYEHVVRFAVR